MAKSTWNVDVSHSMVGFSVKHMMFTTVRGKFEKFSATVIADPEDLTTAEIDFTVDLSSINTNDEGRDNHLRGTDFFDVEKHPTMNFKATSTTKKGEHAYDMTGDLTIRNITKPVTFHVTFEGSGKNPWGAEVAGFAASTTISRKDWDLSWNAALETGGVLVSDQVKIELEIQASKQV